MKLSEIIRCYTPYSTNAAMAQDLCSQMRDKLNYSPSVITLSGERYFIPYPTINDQSKQFGCAIVPREQWIGEDRYVEFYPNCFYDSASGNLLYDDKRFYWNYKGDTESSYTSSFDPDHNKYLCLIFSPIEKNIFSVFGTFTDLERVQYLIPAHQVFIGPYGSSRDYMVYSNTENDNQYTIACVGSGIVNRSTITYKLTTQVQQLYAELQRVICGVAGMPNLYVCSPTENNVLTAYFNLNNYNAYQHMTKAGFMLGDYDYRGCLNPGNETMFFIRTDHQEEADILDGIGIEEEGEFEDDDEGIEYEDD